MQFIFFIAGIFWMGIVLGIIMFMLLVLLHEMGHFITAKKSGVKVLEFGIGIPPKVCKLRTDKSGTIYTLNLLPLGGFVRLKGEDPNNTEDFHAKDSFIRAKIWKKVIILLAGVGMNVIVAWVLFTTVFFLGTKPMTLLPENALKGETYSYLMPTLSFLQKQGFTSGNLLALPTKVSTILPKGIASGMGIQKGDVLTMVNGEKVNIVNVNLVLKNSIGKSLSITYQRGKKTLVGSGMCGEDDCILGVIFAMPDTTLIKPIKFPLGRAMLAGAQEVRAETVLTLGMLGSLGKNLFSFNGHKIKGSVDKLTGPVGVVKLIQDLRLSREWTLILGFTGLISLALALFNVIPLPALDGGRLLGVLIQWIGRFKPEKYFTIENYINVVFFVLLMILGVYIILTDLVKSWGVKIPFLS